MGGLSAIILLGATVMGLHNTACLAVRKQEKLNRSLEILVCGDTNGWLIPCGCTSNQSGGLLRRGTLVREERTRRDVVLLDVGGAPGGVSAYDRAKFEAIIDGELIMEIAAHNLGGPEVALGIDYIRQFGKRKNVPFLSANATDADGRPIVESFHIIKAGGRRIAVTGVVSPQFATRDCLVQEPKAAVLSVLQKLGGQFDVLVVLAYLPEDELRSFASAMPEADILVGGPTGQSIAPLQQGPVLLASATNKGKFLVTITPSDESQARGWRGNVIEVKADFDENKDQLANLDRFRAALAERDFAATESGLRTADTERFPENLRVAGTSACGDCHSTAASSWQSSDHAHAWKTLVVQKAQFDPFCQQCHTTAFGFSGGFVSAGRSPDRVNVGCEGCHGPSQLHTRDPSQRTPQAARDSCVTCHDQENSPKFDFHKYWSAIAHGKENE